TNANWKLTDAIVEKLDKIKVKNIIVSLDSLNPETYGKIRRKGNLDKALKTLNDLNVYSKNRESRGLTGLNIRLNFLFQQDNWKELGDVYDFSVTTKNQVFRTFLYEPEQYSLLTLSEEKRSEILEWYFAKLTLLQILNGARVVRPLIDSLTPINKAYFYQKYHEFIFREKVS
ncbi:MAG: hypothetical protein ACXVAX_06620, partial [Pseudobdellovibrio sp.]